MSAPLLQPASARARVHEAAAVRGDPRWADAVRQLGLDGVVVTAGADGEPAIQDGNRSLLLPERQLELDGGSYVVSCKGAGALTPMYGDPLDEPSPTRTFFGEAWFGEAPFGGQGRVNADIALAITAMADGVDLNGFVICPVLQVVEVPEALVRRDRFWYRRHPGPVLQEHRLVPSDVRLFHAAEHTLGQDPDRVLAAFGVLDASALDLFLDRAIRSGFAALTLFARTAREVPWGLHGLGYGNVWLDKDSVVAPDGTLHFADLEGLDWRLAGADWSLDELVREQLEHNLYEVLYAVDTVQRVHERVSGRRLTDPERRRKVAHRVELALDGDRFVAAERAGGGLDLVITTPLRPAEPVRVRLFDDV